MRTSCGEGEGWPERAPRQPRRARTGVGSRAAAVLVQCFMKCLGRTKPTVFLGWGSHGGRLDTGSVRHGHHSPHSHPNGRFSVKTDVRLGLCDEVGLRRALASALAERVQPGGRVSEARHVREPGYREEHHDAMESCHDIAAAQAQRMECSGTVSIGRGIFFIETDMLASTS